MSKKTIPRMLKDENGIYLPIKPPEKMPGVPEPEKSIDDLLKQGITLIQNAMKHIASQIVAGEVGRETIGSLKDCMIMLHELKKKETEILDTLSDEDIERLVKKQ